ncbi:hypothetical protein J6590_094047, partial [Homalodisca vitripennis]
MTRSGDLTVINSSVQPVQCRSDAEMEQHDDLFTGANCTLFQSDDNFSSSYLYFVSARDDLRCYLALHYQLTDNLSTSSST